MGQLNIRLLVTAAVLLGPGLAIAWWAAKGDWGTGAFIFLPFAAMSLLSFVLSRRIAGRFVPPPVKRATPVFEPSSERPGHAQRRRQRRQSRGGRRGTP